MSKVRGQESECLEHGRLGGVFVWTRPFHRIAVAARGGVEGS